MKSGYGFSLGRGEVESSILSGSTIFFNMIQDISQLAARPMSP
jgi:hypothetical protein